MDSLPEELMLEIFLFLEPKDLPAAFLVSRRFYLQSKKDALWYQMYYKLWSHENLDMKRPFTKDVHFSWRRYFLQKFLMQPGLTWKVITKQGDIPSPRYLHAGGILNKSIYYIGGQLTQTTRYHHVFEFDTETQVFKQVFPIGHVPNFSRQTVVEVGGLFYIFGGFNGRDTEYELAIFDPQSLTWEYPAVQGEVPLSRTNHACAVVGTNMYLFGGLMKHPVTKMLNQCDDFYVLDTKTLTWTNLGPKCNVLPESRSAHKLVAIGKKIYLFGGGCGARSSRWEKKYNNMWIFDTETCQWSLPETTGPLPTCCLFSSCWNLGPFIFAFGGQIVNTVDYEETNDVFVFDTISNSWAKQHISGTLPTERQMTPVNVVHDTVYFLYGYNESRRTALSELLAIKLSPQLFQVL